MQWVTLDPPIPFSKYAFEVGIKIKVRYTEGLASNPEIVEQEFLVGDINSLGGLCDCCSIKKEFTNGMVLAENSGYS